MTLSSPSSPPFPPVLPPVSLPEGFSGVTGVSPVFDGLEPFVGFVSEELESLLEPLPAFVPDEPEPVERAAA